MMNPDSRDREESEGVDRGGRAGRGGRGRFAKRTQNLYNKPQEREHKFSPMSYNGEKTSVATYATTRDAVIQHIQKTYRGGIDIGQSLEDMKVVDLTLEEPTRMLSEKTDAAEKLVDQAGLDIKYQEELRRHLDRKDALREGLNKAYALIVSNYCTKTMQSRIEEHPDYNMTLKNNPIAVLEAIKTLMHDPVRAQYPTASMTDALGRLVNIKQQDHESLLDYVRRFKQQRDIVKSQIGNKFLDEFVDNQPLYQAASTSEEQKKMKDEAYLLEYSMHT
jgi:hypothetical protein